MLTDETVNCYGFRVLTGGIRRERFLKNPVMLYSHDSMVLPIGRWENLREEEGRLLADAVFDRDDPFAREIERKVDEGIIRCCSIGFEILVYDESDGLKLPGQTLGTVTESELLECSVCAIGANRNAMRLSAPEAAPMAKGVRLNLTHEHIINHKIKETMTEQERQEMDQLRTQLQESQSENQALTTERDNLRETVRAAREAEIDRLLSAAVNDGRITENERADWRELMLADTEHAKAALAKLNPRTSLAQMVGKGGKGKGEFDGKTWDELDKGGRLSAYKAQDPEGFRELYKRTFGVDYAE